MSRYIDADKLIERLKFKRDTDTIDRKKYSGLECAIAQCKKAPTADVVEVRHGTWVDNHCTVCGMQPIGDEAWAKIGLTPPKFEYCMSFCPCCGAKMDGERSENGKY